MVWFEDGEKKVNDFHDKSYIIIKLPLKFHKIEPKISEKTNKNWFLRIHIIS